MSCAEIWTIVEGGLYRRWLREVSRICGMNDSWENKTYLMTWSPWKQDFQRMYTPQKSIPCRHMRPGIPYHHWYFSELIEEKLKGTK